MMANAEGSVSFDEVTPLHSPINIDKVTSHQGALAVVPFQTREQLSY